MTAQLERQFTALFKECARLNAEMLRAAGDNRTELASRLNLYIQGMQRAVGILAELDGVSARELEVLEKRIHD